MKNSIWIKSGIPLIIILVAFVIAAIMISSRKPPEQIPVETQAFLVDAKPMEYQPVSFVVDSQGNVVPRNKTSLSAQVSGRVVSLSDKFIVGGMFQKGDVLITLEQDDYRTEVKLAEAELAQARAALEEELARGKVAEQEWRSVSSVVPPELGLRKPQLAKEQANVKASEAKLERANRNLDRTLIRAPYNGIVVERNIDLGQFVSAGATVSTVYSTDTAEVRLPITDKDLMFVDIGNQSSNQSDVTLNATVGGKNRTWTGKLVRSEGILDSGSRVLYAVVEVKDPYQFNGGDNAPLRFGQFVQAKIVSHQKQDLTVLPRSILRLDNTVLTVNDNREIEIVPVDVVRTTADEAFIGSGLNSGALVVTSAVPNPYNGMKVRLPGDEPAMPPEAENDKESDTHSVDVKDDTTVTSPASSGGK
ncbi:MULTISPECIES: efflux RND transporter periplasmic adaptor subunit [Alteromonas]|uniref:Efflux RND transporter periplasmic adaptor subunit n=1 Tax=Alteromonas stellipolaris TaxID=233316 RepID=A0AAW7YU58_9ALTE|nr:MULTISPECIES: efflux RND transporter periplasmic adaptor subunit [Alteromonas]AMJ86214.1 efflux transporter periplasmic adaptor subunit [Alteromonas sp. Mac1]AMJ90073.1 efflux transporter periplasmic adaptor subunit [Alteromonas sp. Mac2]ANB22614.1 efflux transporter periplasmic adaptor subunit [Alteromonas stellipolaris]MDO6575869.1 efflux RND transporter periplasmic adaptor subunit [Alteromonas stellipolaris]